MNTLLLLLVVVVVVLGAAVWAVIWKAEFLHDCCIAYVW